VIFSDGLDVDKIEELHAQFPGRVRVSFGWGTLLTNDFRGLVPDDALAPFSWSARRSRRTGRPTVKLSDNPEKAMGPEAEIARYKRVFGVGEQERMEVVVRSEYPVVIFDGLPNILAQCYPGANQQSRICN
jgi:nicotinate phosphoribosyltransferase